MTKGERSVMSQRVLYLLATHTYMIFLLARMIVLAVVDVRPMYSTFVRVCLVTSLMAATVGVPDVVRELIRRRKPKYYLGLALLADSLLLFTIFALAQAFAIEVPRAVLLGFTGGIFGLVMIILAFQLRWITDSC